MYAAVIAFIVGIVMVMSPHTLAAAPAASEAPAYGVVMGDSIVSGYPVPGRLNPKAGTYSPDHKDQPGQLAYELRQLTARRWVNNAVAGQTTVQILSRWCRDALDSGCDPGDGLGSDTLPGRPDFVVMSAGINDIFKGVDFATTRRNLAIMVQSAAENHIKIIVYTAYMYDPTRKDLQAKIEALNAWIIRYVPKMGGYVYRYDSFADKYAAQQKKYYIDKIHPGREGQKLIAKQLFNRYTFLHPIQTKSPGSP